MIYCLSRYIPLHTFFSVTMLTGIIGAGCLSALLTLLDFLGSSLKRQFGVKVGNRDIYQNIGSLDEQAEQVV